MIWDYDTTQPNIFATKIQELALQYQITVESVYTALDLMDDRLMKKAGY